MRIGICDDREQDRSFLRQLLEEYCTQRGLECRVEQFSNGRALLKAFSPGKYQILFLDIYMPGYSGMQAAQEIREQDEHCFLAFTTTSEEHALESYGVYAAGYLLKPYSREQLYEVMDWCMEHMPPLSRALNVFSDRENVSLPLREIRYIEVFGREAVFHTAKQTVSSTSRSLSEVEKELPEDFLRCHRSYIVNMNEITRIEQNDFVLKSGEKIPIGAENAAKNKQSFFDWIFRHTWEGK